MTSGVPKDAKHVDIIVFRRVVKRLISDRVTAKELDRFVDEARYILEEVIGEVRYEKTFLINPQPSTKKEKAIMAAESMMERYAPLFERLAKE